MRQSAASKVRARPGDSGRSAVSGQVRIVGGDLRRSIIPVIDIEGLRPTPDRVRETLFNWLGQTLGPIRVLDAFAGSGALGFEALSRGAAQVDFFETNAVVRRQLEQTRSVLLPRLPVSGRAAEVAGRDVCSHLRQLAADSAGVRYGLAFLDPPFRSDWLLRALPDLLACMAQEAAVYVEWHQPLDEEPQVMACLEAAGWCVRRAQKAGQVHFHLLMRTGRVDSEATMPDNHAPELPANRIAGH